MGRSSSHRLAQGVLPAAEVLRLVCRRRLWADFTRVGVRPFCCPHLQMAFHSGSETGLVPQCFLWAPPCLETHREELGNTRDGGQEWDGGSAEALLSFPVPPLPPCREFSFCLQDTLLLQAWEACLFFWEKNIVLSHGEWPGGRFCLGFTGSANIYRVLSMCRHCLLCVSVGMSVEMCESSCLSLSQSGKVGTTWATCLTDRRALPERPGWTRELGGTFWLLLLVSEVSWYR